LLPKISMWLGQFIGLSEKVCSSLSKLKRFSRYFSQWPEVSHSALLKISGVFTSP